MSSDRRYLALVENVSEVSPTAHLDVRSVEQLVKSLASQGYQEARRALQLLFSPTQSLVRLTGVRRLSLRVLGEITPASGSPGLVLHSQPPRPQSIVCVPPREPPVRRPGRCGAAGWLASYNPQVRVVLDPRRLTTHMLVVGQTGSGKTETVKRIVAEYSWRKHLFSARSNGGGVVVVDVTGEYTGYPYMAPDVRSLLDVYFHSRTGVAIDDTVRPEWLDNAGLTIIVPYEAPTIGYGVHAEERCVDEVVKLVSTFSSRYGVTFAGLVFGRNHVYEIEVVGGVAARRKASRREAARLLRGERYLVVAVPLPASLDVDTLFELSKSKSEAFPDVVESLTERLGLLELGLVRDVAGLAELVSVYQRSGGVDRAVSRLLRALNRAVEAYRGAGESAVEAFKAMSRELYGEGPVRYAECYALTALAALVAASEAAASLLEAPVCRGAGGAA